MERQRTYGVTSWTIPVVMVMSLFLAGCSRLIPEPEIKTVVKVERVQIPTVARPKPLQLNDTRVFVVTEENFDEFVKEFSEIYGDVAFVALSMKDYENLALNIADLRRYINQQTEIIVYYEKAVTEEPKETE
jgi:hypothetical protein